MIAQQNNLKGNTCKASLPASYRHQRYIILLRIKVIAPRRRRLIEPVMTTPSPLIHIPAIPLHLVPPPPREVDSEALQHLFRRENQGMHPAFLREQMARSASK